MDLDALRARQQPLKDGFREDPSRALVTLTAEGELSSLDVSCSVHTGRALVEAGLHPMTGGDGTLACSGDMLLQALVACAGVTLRAVATARGLAVAGTVRAEGTLDFRGTLGLDRDVPVGFQEIRLTLDLESDASGDAIEELVSTTQRYCVVLQTLRSGVDVETAWTVTPAAESDGVP